MAAPVDAARTTYNGSTSSTSHSPSLAGLGTISAGDYLVALLRCPTSTTSISISGWTPVAETTSDGSTGPDRTALFVKVAAGSDTASVTLGTAGRLAGIFWRVTGADTYAVSSVATGSNAAPDSPALTHSAETRDVLTFTLGGQEDTRTVTTTPTNYTNTASVSNTGGATNTNCTVFGATRGQTGITSENPGAWTMSATENWAVWTLTVYTAAPKIRVTQQTAQVLAKPDDTKIRVTQQFAMVLVTPLILAGEGKSRFWIME